MSVTDKKWPKSRRNYGCRISDDYTCKGLRTLFMENEKLRVSFLLDKGTDIFEFLHKPQGIDFMLRAVFYTDVSRVSSIY